VRTHSWIIAALGSLVTALALRYPLVAGWMARYVPGAPAANAAQVTSSVISGAVLLLASAALAARLSGAQTRAGAAGAGALAGLLAGGLTFALYGAPAAGVAGAQPVYPFVLAPAQADARVELIKAVLGCATWTYGMGWAMGLGGGIAGVLVGALVGSRPSATPPSSLPAQTMVVVVALVCCLGLVVDVALLSLLGQTIARAAAEANYTPPISPYFPWYVAVGSPLVILIVALLGAWLHTRRRTPGAAEARHVARVSYTLGILAILTVALVRVMNVRAFFSVIGIGLVAVLALGVLLLILGRRRGLEARQGEREERAALPGLLALVGLGLVGGTAMVALAQLFGMAFALNLNLLVVPVIPNMVTAAGPAQGPLMGPASTLALTNYTFQAGSALRAWIVLCGIFVLGLLLWRGLLWLWGQRAR